MIPRSFPPRRRQLLRIALLLIPLILLTACGKKGQADTPYLSQRPAAAPSSSAPAASALNLFTQESGPYRVTFAALRQAGLLSDPAQLSTLGLTHLGQPVPVWVDGTGPDAGLIFVAEPVISDYTRQNVYRLQGDPVPLRPTSPAAASATQTADHAQATLHLEENRRYTPLPESGDHWFWEQVRPTRPLAIPVTLTALGTGPATLDLSVWGGSEEPAVNPDHHLRLTVNGQTVLDEMWDGKGWQKWQAQLPGGLLADGENKFEVNLPGVDGATAESVFVDSLALAYPRQLVAQAGRLAFVGPGAGVTLSGLAGEFALFDITDPAAWFFVEKSGGDLWPTQGGHDYLAVNPAALPAPQSIQPILPGPLLQDIPTGAGADYLLIGPPDLLAAAAPLLDLRRQQGLTPLAVPLQRIYDDFNHGLAEPEALRTFLAHAAQNWTPAPRYVLLLGDATYDPKGYTTAPDANRLPSFWVYTVFGGQTVTDVDFARLDADPAAPGDPLPDVALGRLPARTPDQVTTVVDKILAYEAGDGAAAWRQQVLAVADGSEPSFRQEAQNFLDLVPAAYTSDLFSPSVGQADVGAQTVDRVQAGDFAVAYFGHGSVTQWGKDQLLTVDNSAALGNGDRLPIFLNFTCLTGLFTHPTVESLTESLLWQPGGAIASLASTSLTLADNQSALIDAMTGHLFAPTADGAPLRLGDAFLAAQRQLPTGDTNSLDVLNTFLLFGDPALVVAR